MRISIALAVTSIFAISLPLKAESSWSLISHGSDETAFYADIFSLKESSTAGPVEKFSTIKIWVKSERPKKSRSLDKSSKMLFSINCIENSYHIISTIRYAASGRVLYSHTDIDDYNNDYTPVAPETVGADIVSFTCRSKDALLKLHRE
jgi:hypothetical protein